MQRNRHSFLLRVGVRMGINKLFAATAYIAFFPLLATNAYAQQIDYSELEKLFDEPVTTSATGKPQRVSESPVAMDIITADQIRRSGAENIAQLLGRLPGVVNWQETRAISDVGIRGQNFNPNSTMLVQVNGRQVYIDTYGYTDWSLIPVQLEEIKQIEVVKGPNTALFGFNAASGVINIVTYNPKYDDVSEAGVTVGTGSYLRGYGMHSFSVEDKNYTRISAGYKGFDQFDSHSKTAVLTGGAREDSPELTNFNLDSLFQLTEQTQMRFEVSRAETKADFNVFYYFYPYEADINSVKGTLTSETDIGRIEAKVYQNYYTAYSGVLGMPLANRITVAQLEDIFQAGTDHTFRVFGEYRNNSMTSSYGLGAGGEVSYDVYSGGGMWNWNFAPDWELSNAVRYDNQILQRDGPTYSDLPFTNGNADFDQHLDFISVNSGLVWKATDVDSFRLSYGRGLQVPSLWNTGLWITTYPGLVVAGKPDLKPAITNNYEIGYNRLLPKINGKFRTSVFYRKTKNFSTYSSTTYPAGSTTIQQASEIGDNATKGIELAINGEFGEHWIWDANYTFQSTQDWLAPNFAFHGFNFEDTVPDHIVNVHLGWAKEGWEADMYAQATSDFMALDLDENIMFVQQEMDPYFTLSGRVAYTFDNAVTLALSGVDISQRRTATNFGYENERQIFLSVSKKF